MQTKLTLRMEEGLIRRAKMFSKKTGKSVSKIVADYFEKLDVPSADEIGEITPKIASLKGILKGTGVTEEEYLRYLEENHL